MQSIKLTLFYRYCSSFCEDFLFQGERNYQVYFSCVLYISYFFLFGLKPWLVCLVNFIVKRIDNRWREVNFRPFKESSLTWDENFVTSREAFRKSTGFRVYFSFLVLYYFLSSCQLFNLVIFHFFPFRGAISIFGVINAQDSLLGSSKCGHFSLLVVFTFQNPQELLSVDGK